MTPWRERPEADRAAIRAAIAAHARRWLDDPDYRPAMSNVQPVRLTVRIVNKSAPTDSLPK